MHRIVHTEFCSNDPQATADAMALVFGWKMTPMNMGDEVYILWNYPDDEKAGGGGIYSGVGSWTGPTTIEYIEVENIANSIVKAESVGSKVTAPEQPIGPNGEHGHYAIVNLPGDCAVGFWSKSASK